jgi:class 3 adenylate cyclase
MSRETIHCTVIFADVAGSTALYDAHGNAKAKAAIEDSINRMAEISRRHGGVVIKIIGDEIMCRFNAATECVRAACEIQEAMRIPSGPDKFLLSVRIGLHAGEAILENSDVFGDAVNIAARMAGIAKATQIITTEETFNQLSPDLQKISREFDITELKGKQKKFAIYDIMWDEEDVTRMASTLSHAVQDIKLTINYKGEDRVLTQNSIPVVLGRGSMADITIDAPHASRNHFKVEYNRGKFVLTDQSTNGTYVKLADGKEVYLRRERLPLSSTGAICLGEKVDESNPLIIRFSVS